MARSKEFEPDVVLERAMDLFWERGYEKTSLQDLVERMGIGRRSLYDTFGDKQTLFAKSLKRYIALQESTAGETAEQAADARQAIQHLLEASVVGGAVLRRGCLAVNSATEVAPDDPEIAGGIQRHFASSRLLLQELVERGQRDGSVARHHDSAALTTTLFNAWLGLRVRVRAGVSLDLLMAELNATLSLLD